MIDSLIFLLIIGGFAILLTPVFFYYHIDPAFIFIPVVLLLIPGFYACWIGGPYVKSSEKRRKTMLKLAKIKPGDVVYDLGCGDGALVFAAAKKGAQAIGYELSIPLYLWGNFQKLLGRKGQIRYGNIWKQDFRNADLIFCYLLPKSMVRFYKTIWPTLKKGTCVVSNAFPIKEIKPQRIEEKVYLYVKT